MIRILCVLLLGFTLSVPSAQAQVPPKAKAFLKIVGYGTVGGALLGFAALAFGARPRTIAQGASVGLYAGIAFGAYILYSHSQRKEGKYQDDISPYSEDLDGESSYEGDFFTQMDEIEYLENNPEPTRDVALLNVRLVNIQF